MRILPTFLDEIFTFFLYLRSSDGIWKLLLFNLRIPLKSTWLVTLALFLSILKGTFNILGVWTCLS